MSSGVELSDNHAKLPITLKNVNDGPLTAQGKLLKSPDSQPEHLHDVSTISMRSADLLIRLFEYGTEKLSPGEAVDW